MRRISALAVAACVVAGLAACSTPGTADDCTTDVTSGASSDAVQAPGAFGEAPTVEFPVPLITDEVQRTELIEGDGETIEDGQPVLIDATILSGTDASVVQETAYTPGAGSLFTVGDEGLASLGEGLECATVGSRVAIVAPAEEGSTESVVFVVDVLDAFPARADGTNQLPKVGMPSVVTAPDGTPGVTVPSAEAPTEYREAVLKLGDGKKVASDDVIVAKVTSVNWETGELAESTWTTGAATIISLADPALAPALLDAIEGKRVGSQIIAVAPSEPAAEGNAAAASTLIYVIDILGTVN